MSRSPRRRHARGAASSNAVRTVRREVGALVPRSPGDRSGTHRLHAVQLLFLTGGLGFASLATRLPEVRDVFQVSATIVGLWLLCMSLGSLSVLPFSGLLMGRLGVRRVLCIGIVANSIGLVAVGGASLSGSIWLMTAGSLLAGFGTGLWNPAMNVAGGAIEARTGKGVLPRLHGFFSLGAVVGAGIGTLCIAVSVSPGVQITLVALASAAVAYSASGALPRAKPRAQ